MRGKNRRTPETRRARRWLRKHPQATVAELAYNCGVTEAEARAVVTEAAFGPSLPATDALRLRMPGSFEHGGRR